MTHVSWAKSLQDNQLHPLGASGYSIAAYQDTSHRTCGRPNCTTYQQTHEPARSRCRQESKFMNNFLVVGQKNMREQSSKADKELHIYIIIFTKAVSSSTLQVNTEESEELTPNHHIILVRKIIAKKQVWKLCKTRPSPNREF